MKTTPEHMALPLELKNIALQLQDDLEAARVARDAWERKYHEHAELLAERDEQVNHWHAETTRLQKQLQAQSDAFALCDYERGHLRRHLRNLAEAAEWYRRCLEDVQDGHRVTGVQEAKLTYFRAHSRAMKELED